MTTFFMTLYILMWPAIALVVLTVLSIGVYKDFRDAKREGRMVV